MKLGKKKLLPHNVLIVGASQQSTPSILLAHLGDYPEEFCCPAILDCKGKPESKHDESADTTYFLSPPGREKENGIINLKELNSDDPDHSRVLSRNLLTASADHLQS